MSSTPGNEGSSRILVSNISMTTSEDTLREFFNFCGGIQAMHLYSTEAGTQEAVIKFDCGASASTACLLNNALVDSAHITIKSLPSVEERKSASPSSQAGPASPKDMVAGFFASAWSYGATLAGSVAESAKQFDEQHKITDKVSHAAATAWTATVDTATTVDEKLKISETTTKLFEDVKTKVGVQPAASPAAAGSTGPAGDAPSPRPASAKPASPK